MLTDYSCSTIMFLCRYIVCIYNIQIWMPVEYRASKLKLWSQLSGVWNCAFVLSCITEWTSCKSILYYWLYSVYTNFRMPMEYKALKFKLWSRLSGVWTYVIWIVLSCITEWTSCKSVLKPISSENPRWFGGFAWNRCVWWITFTP